MRIFYGTLTALTQQLKLALVQITQSLIYLSYEMLTWNTFMNFYPCPHPGKFIQSPSFD